MLTQEREKVEEARQQAEQLKMEAEKSAALEREEREKMVACGFAACFYFLQWRIES